MTDDAPATPTIPVGAVVRAVLTHPSLWYTALRQWARMTPRGWWRSAPFLPVPPADYMEFRMVTQYGGGHGDPRTTVDPADVVDYLRWCKAWKDGR